MCLVVLGAENRELVAGYWIDGVETPHGKFRIPPTELEEMLPQIRDQLTERAVDMVMQELRGRSNIVITPLSE